MHLFRDGLLPTTIISHCTSVASVLRHWAYNPAANLHIKLLIRAFRLERPVQRRIMPKWDLHLVLLTLMRPPFALESDEQDETSDDVIPLKWRTIKTVFLLALASATVFASSAGLRPSATKNWARPASFPFRPASFSSFPCLKIFKDEFRAGKFWNLNAKTAARRRSYIHALSVAPGRCVFS